MKALESLKQPVTRSREFLEECWAELKKVHWPNRKETQAAKVVELVKGKKKTSSRKFFPGYILVNMKLNNETWHIVKSTPKVTGFLGGATDPGSIPSISEAEVREITHQMAEGAVKPKPKVLF